MPPLPSSAPSPMTAAPPPAAGIEGSLPLPSSLTSSSISMMCSSTHAFHGMHATHAAHGGYPASAASMSAPHSLTDSREWTPPKLAALRSPPGRSHPAYMTPGCCPCPVCPRRRRRWALASAALAQRHPPCISGANHPSVAPLPPFVTASPPVSAATLPFARSRPCVACRRRRSRPSHRWLSRAVRHSASRTAPGRPPLTLRWTRGQRVSSKACGNPRPIRRRRRTQLVDGRGRWIHRRRWGGAPPGVGTEPRPGHRAGEVLAARRSARGGESGSKRRAEPSQRPSAAGGREGQRRTCRSCGARVPPCGYAAAVGGRRGCARCCDPTAADGPRDGATVGGRNGFRFVLGMCVCCSAGVCTKDREGSQRQHTDSALPGFEVSSVRAVVRGLGWLREAKRRAPVSCNCLSLPRVRVL